MNPEDNNPIANPGIPGADATTMNDPMNMATSNGLTMADGLASAQDNLTSAGLAASTGAGLMDLNQLGATAPEAMMTPPMEEPLIPAAPVPGSIGSVTSVPPVATDFAGEAAPSMPADFANATAPANGTAAPASEPAATPYNPFAQPAAPAAPGASANATAPAPESTPAPTPGMTPNPAFQPPVPPKAKMKLSPLAIVLGVLAAILLVTTIVFVALFIDAKNHPKVIYTPAPSEESNARIDTLSCAREDDFGYYAGYDYPAMGSQNMSASYTNNELRALTVEYAMRFEDEEAAGLAQAVFSTEQAEVFATIEPSFSIDYKVNGGNLDIEIASGRDSLTENNAAILMYGMGGADSSVSLEAVRSLYESNGFTCTVE